MIEGAASGRCLVPVRRFRDRSAGGGRGGCVYPCPPGAPRMQAVAERLIPSRRRWPKPSARGGDRRYKARSGPPLPNSTPLPAAWSGAALFRPTRATK